MKMQRRLIQTAKFASQPNRWRVRIWPKTMPIRAKIRRHTTKQTGWGVPAETWAIDCPCPRMRAATVRIIWRDWRKLTQWRAVGPYTRKKAEP